MSRGNVSGEVRLFLKFNSLGDISTLNSYILCCSNILQKSIQLANLCNSTVIEIYGDIIRVSHGFFWQGLKFLYGYTAFVTGAPAESLITNHSQPLQMFHRVLAAVRRLQMFHRVLTAVRRLQMFHRVLAAVRRLQMFHRGPNKHHQPKHKR